MSNFGMIKISEKISVSIFSLLTLMFFFFGQGLAYGLIFLSCIVLHELSHIFFLHRYGAKIIGIVFYPFGIDIKADTSRLSYKKEIICTLAGSLVNLIFCVISHPLLLLNPSPALLFFTLCNLFLGLLNLIPLSFFDGGKALRLIFYDAFDIDKAFYLHKATDILSSLLLVIFLLFCANEADFNFSVCAVILYAAFSTLALSKKLTVS